MPGFEACIEALQREILGGDPATAGGLKQLDQAAKQQRSDRERQQIERDEHKAADEAREHARRCVDDQSTVGEARDGRRDYTFRYVNTCAEPVHLAFCAVDGPDRPSVRRRLTVPPGATEQFVLRLGHIAPIVVLDHCLDAAQCREAGPRDCNDS